MVAVFISCIIPIVMECVTLSTVNSEIFARILFSRNFAYAEFRENKNPRKIVKTLCLYLMKANHIKVANFYLANMPFNATRENKILANIYEVTVYACHIRVPVCHTMQPPFFFLNSQFSQS